MFHTHNIERLSDYREAGIRTIKLEHIESPSGQFSSGGEIKVRYEAIHNDERITFRTKPVTQELRAEISKHKIDMMVYPAPERESFEVGVPYIMAIHDIAHRLLPQFREFNTDGIYQQREYVYTNGIENARVILADSEVGKDQLMENYDTEPGKIIVLPFVPPPYLLEESQADNIDKIRLRHHLLDKFLFYPAQFWPHKNHENLVKAISFVKEVMHEEIQAVFVGSKQERWNGFERVTNLAKALGVDDQIVYLGYVDPADMRGLYKMATALVMPTFLGPTNLPILEAFKMGCPVIASNIKGAQEQVGDAGILVDPKIPEEIGSAIYRVWTDKALRKRLVKGGYGMINKWTREDFSNRLQEIVNMCKERLGEGKRGYFEPCSQYRS